MRPVALAAGDRQRDFQCVEIRARTADSDWPRAPHDNAILTVDDRGIGIEPADLGRIFNRFERARSAPQQAGLGLGLYIAREIVIQHGGSIRADRRRGGGSRFSIIVPLINNPAQSI